jgi:hypothetical protein
MDDTFHAIVQSVHLRGPHGPYAFAMTEEGAETKKVTFSLNENVWQESEMPEEGVYVVISQLRKKRKGWRAYHARFLTPADEKPVPPVPTSQSSQSSKER